MTALALGAETQTPAAQLASFAIALDYDEIPSEVTEATKLHLLDACGCAIGAYGLGSAAYVRTAAREIAGAGTASVVGEESGWAPAAAALSNGALVHALDFDDTHTPSICHISAVVVPAALAVAEARGLSGRDLLAAIVVGSEAVARIGSTAAPAYMKTGFHPTSVCGVFGAALAASRLRGLDAEATKNALGIAGSMASGLFEYLADGSTAKVVNVGWASHAGVMSAALAAAGGDGPATVLEGRFGLFATHFRLFDPPATDWDLGARWEVPSIAFKPYPSCHFTHSALDAASLLRSEGLDPAAIEAVFVGVPEAAVPLVLEPREDKIQPRTPFDAKFSLQYSLATMLVRGEVGVGSYRADAIADEDVLRMAGRVFYKVEHFPDYPAVFPARLTVRLRSGDVITRLVPDGAIPARLDSDDVHGKFRANAGLGLEAADARELESAVQSVEDQDDLHEALAPLRRARSEG
jgi:2-methylcitrate dehydratase PrpD